MSDCRQALALLSSGLDQQTCHDFRQVREVAMCSAWQSVRAERSWADLGPALRQAWARIRTDCAAHGGTTPEVGFLPPAAAAPAPAPEISAVYQVLRAGRPIGVVVQESDGTLTSCVGGDCRTWSAPAAGGDLPGALAALSGGDLTAVRL